MMEWIKLAVLLVTLITGGALAWGRFDKRLALMHQRLDQMEGNHLKHVQDDMAILSTEIKTVRESQIRMEVILNNTTNGKNNF